MSWLRERVESGEAKSAQVESSDEPWVPSILAAAPSGVLRRLTYAVLDEHDDDGLSFVLTAWPYLDALGRVRHRLRPTGTVMRQHSGPNEVAEERRIQSDIGCQTVVTL